jgi:hypothetical protein
MSALGQKRTLKPLNPMSALPPKADIRTRNYHVRFVPKADIRVALSGRSLPTELPPMPSPIPRAVGAVHPR